MLWIQLLKRLKRLKSDYYIFTVLLLKKYPRIVRGYFFEKDLVNKKNMIEFLELKTGNNLFDLFLKADCFFLLQKDEFIVF